MECTRNQKQPSIPTYYLHPSLPAIIPSGFPWLSYFFHGFSFTRKHGPPGRPGAGNGSEKFPWGQTQVSPSSENRCQARHGPRALQPRDRRAYLGPRDITLILAWWKELVMWGIKSLNYTHFSLVLVGAIHCNVKSSGQKSAAVPRIQSESWTFLAKEAFNAWVSVWAVAKMLSQDMAGPCVGNKHPVIKGT